MSMSKINRKAAITGIARSCARDDVILTGANYTESYNNWVKHLSKVSDRKLASYVVADPENFTTEFVRMCERFK